MIFEILVDQMCSRKKKQFSLKSNKFWSRNNKFNFDSFPLVYVEEQKIQ